MPASSQGDDQRVTTPLTGATAERCAVESENPVAILRCRLCVSDGLAADDAQRDAIACEVRPGAGRYWSLPGRGGHEFQWCPLTVTFSSGLSHSGRPSRIRTEELQETPGYRRQYGRRVLGQDVLWVAYCFTDIGAETALELDPT